MKFTRNQIVVFFLIVLILLTLSSPAFAENNYSFLRSVKTCHDYIRENDFYYSRGVALPLDREGNRRADCSSFLSWCLHEETDGAFYESKDSAWFNAVAEALLNGRTPDMPEVTGNWKVITNLDHLVPGDIMCYRKHVQIYAGKNNDGKHLVYSAGCDSTIQDVISVISDTYFYRAKYGIRIS